MGAGLQMGRVCHECGKVFTIENAALWAYKLKHYDKTHWFCRYNCMRAAEKKRAAKGRKKPTTRKPAKEELDALLDGGMSIAEIAGKYDCHKSTVHHWIKIYGLKGIKERRMAGSKDYVNEKLKEETAIEPTPAEAECADEMPELPELEPVQQGMHPRVKLAFKNLRDELLIAMGRDQTSPKDAEIYGHVHAHVFSLEAIYKDILGGR